MPISRRATLLSAGALALPAGARAQSRPIRIGVLADYSGPFSNSSGPTSTVCANQALIDLGVATRGLAVEVIQADHQNKPDVALALVRRWFDQDGVDMVTEVNNSAIALGVAQLAREKNKVLLATGAASSALTAEQCTPNMIHWSYDTWMMAHAVGKATVQAGGDSWFFITSDFGFGHQMERDTGRFVTEGGGRVLGGVKVPLGTTEFSSYLVQAQASRAKVVGLCLAGLDMVNGIKQAQEFGLPRRGQQLAAPFLFITDVHALGLDAAQGLRNTEVFYWDLNARTRAFTDRVRPKAPTNWPNGEHAGTYSAVTHYLKVALELGAARTKASGLEVVNRMKAMPTDDDALGQGRIREDGRKIHPTYLFEVKRPAESRGPWDYMKLVGTVPMEEAFRPLAEGNCPLVRR